MRTMTLLNTGWTFVKTAAGPLEAAQASGEAVTLPHTWNAVDGQDGGNDYHRGTCWYVRTLERPSLEKDGEAWLEFAGAAMTAEVYLNGEKLACHEGGYSTFRVNLTEHLQKENTLAVSVDNSDNDRVYPQKADFTFYGGLYREVRLICVPKVHFDLSYCGAPGIKVTPVVDLENQSARVTVETWQTGAGDVTIAAAGRSQTVTPVDGLAQAVFTIENVRLWDGTDDPYLYTAAAALSSGDEVSVRFGCRKFEIDPQRGFLLNGRSYPLRGVSRHQDRKGAGNALTMEMHREDMAIVREIGEIGRASCRERV